MGAITLFVHKIRHPKVSFNGGVDAHRFELLIQNYVRNLVLYNKFEKILELSSKYSEILT